MWNKKIIQSWAITSKSVFLLKCHSFQPKNCIYYWKIRVKSPPTTLNKVIPQKLSTVLLLPCLCIGIVTPSTQDKGKYPLLKNILNTITSLSVSVSQVFTKKSFMSRSEPALLSVFDSFVAFMTSACLITPLSFWNEAFNTPSSYTRIRSYISSSAIYETSVGFSRSFKYSKKSVHVYSEEVGDLIFLIIFHISLELCFWAFIRRSVLVQEH